MKAWRNPMRRGGLGAAAGHPRRRFLAALTALALVSAPAAAQDVPDAPPFRIADAVADGGDRLLVWLDPGWDGWDDAPDAIEARVGDGPPAALQPAMAGLHALEGLIPGQPVEISLRSRRDGVASPWSAPLSATPTAAAPERFAVWADGFEAAFLEVSPTHVAVEPMDDPAAVAAGSAALNAPLTLPGGAEIEYVGGPDSLFVRWFAYDDRRNGPDSNNPSPRPTPEVRARHFEPAGRYADLAPLEVRETPFRVRFAGDRADRAGVAVVLGATGAATQPAMAAVGLDADGDPVRFRFDRLRPTGLHPDGRPWVQGPVRILRNGAPPIDANPGDVVAKDGALLSVVARPGLAPPPRATLSADGGAAYRPLDPHSYDWSDWDDAASRTPDGLTARGQFDTLHLYLDGAEPGPVALRFRPIGGLRWFAAQPLLYDPRLPPAGALDIRDVAPGAHRGAIFHLAPGTAYEVEARQGDRYWRAGALTRTLKPARARVETVGVIDGDLTITKGGPPGAYVEYRDGLVRGGRVLIAASRVILRDVDVLGAPANAVELAPGVRDVRIVRGRIAGWGRSDDGLRAGNLGWGAQLDSALAGAEGGAETAAARAARSRDDVAVIGTRFGPPRHSANAWEEWNPSIGDRSRMRPNTNRHPWGPSAISVRDGSWRGGWSVSDVSIVATPLRSLNDALSGNHNFAPDVGGFGPDFVLAHSYVSGAVDDLVEHEGAAPAGVILGNFFDAEPARSYTRSPRFHLALSTAYWGPTYVARNVLRRVSPARHEGRSVDGRGFKIQRDPDRGEEHGRMVFWHNTIFGDGMLDALSGSGGPLRFVTGRNNLFHVRPEEASDLIEDPTNDWRDGALVLSRREAAMAFNGADHRLLAEGPWVRAAVPLANINDAGPFAWAGPAVFGAAAGVDRD
jgi:hypothetical protein